MADDKPSGGKCVACNGRGVVLANLSDFGFGRGFRQFMSAGCLQRQNDDGATFHEIVCPRCDGAGVIFPPNLVKEQP